MKYIPSYADLNRFYRFVRPYRTRASMALALTGIVGALGGVIPALLKPYVDTVVFGSGSSGSLLFPLLIVLFAFVESSLTYAANYLTVWVGRHIGNDLKVELYQKLLHFDPAFFDHATSGEVLIHFNNDADLASEGLLDHVRTLLVRSVTSIFLVGVMLYYSWILAIVAVGCLVVTVVPLSRVRRRLKQYIAQTVASGAEVATHFNEAYSGNRVISSYNLYDYVENRLRETLQKLFRLHIKTIQRTSSLTLVMHTATAIGIAVTVWLQSYLIKSGHMSPGDFVACITALLMLYTPIKKIGSSMSAIQTSFMAIERVLAALDVKPDIVSPPRALPVSGVKQGIVYDQVHFSYEPGKPVLKGINLTIGVGETVAFVGSSGGGKTTLVNLLPRFYDVSAGAVRLDGVDVRELDLVSLRDHIAMVFQDNFLFGGTIRENIQLGRRGASPAELDAAVKSACLGDFIATLENGLDTQIGERGVMLSGGQKQRVSIARAFLKNAPIVILDEATSALDASSEEVVQEAVENLTRNSTVLIIAHRLSTVINADRIVVLKDGVIEEEGRHEELLAKGGIYSGLYKTQLV